MPGSVAFANGAGSRSDHLSGFVGSYPSFVTYISKDPLCGAVPL